MIPLLEIHLDTSREIQFVINLCLLFVECTVHKYFTSDTDYRPSCCVFRKWCYDIYCRWVCTFCPSIADKGSIYRAQMEDAGW